MQNFTLPPPPPPLFFGGGLDPAKTQKRTLGPRGVLPQYRHKLLPWHEVGHFITTLLPWGHVNDNGLAVPMNHDTETQLIGD